MSINHNNHTHCDYSTCLYETMDTSLPAFRKREKPQTSSARIRRRKSAMSQFMKSRLCLHERASRRVRMVEQ